MVTGPQKIWACSNVVGIALFLVLASKAWIEPEVVNESVAIGPYAILWGVTALPILLLFLALHLATGSWAAIRAVRERRWDWVALVSASLACWILAFVFDGIHHGA